MGRENSMLGNWKTTDKTKREKRGEEEKGRGE